MSKYTGEFKLKVIDYSLSGQGGQKKTARQFGVPRIMVRTWLSVYEQHGREGLNVPRQHYEGEFKCRVVDYMHEHAPS